MKEQRIRINVGGMSFHCYPSTLQRYPNTKLARLTETSDDFDTENNEYFFDRNPLVFSFILEAYRTGTLHLPRDICGQTLEHELEFWELSPAIINECCWKAFYKSGSDIEVIKKLTENYFRNRNLCVLAGSQARTLKTRLWLFLDEPQTSRFAMAWGVLLMIVVVLSTLVDAMETIEALRIPLDVEKAKFTQTLKEEMGLANSTDRNAKAFGTELHPVLQYLDIGFFVLLTIDIGMRILSCPSIKKYLKCLLHISEIICIIDFWVVVAMDKNMQRLSGKWALYVYLFARTLLILKLFRLFRLCRYIPELHIVSLSLKSSKREIGILGAILVIWVIFFGYLTYGAEMFENDTFPNAFAAMYWAVITITTVGYGDLYPDTPIGRTIACACSVCSLIMLALPVGVIASSFKTLYSHHLYAEKHIRKYELTSIDGPKYCHGNISKKSKETK